MLHLTCSVGTGLKHKQLLCVLGFQHLYSKRTANAQHHSYYTVYNVYPSVAISVCVAMTQCVCVCGGAHHCNVGVGRVVKELDDGTRAGGPREEDQVASLQAILDDGLQGLRGDVWQRENPIPEDNYNYYYN